MRSEGFLWEGMIIRPYLINSNSPSGGTKLIVLSESNFPNWTHWWNWQSSISTALVLLWDLFNKLTYRKFLNLFKIQDCTKYTYNPLCDVSFSSNNLSLSPNLHSGVPERYALIIIWPDTSALNVVPSFIKKQVEYCYCLYNAFQKKLNKKY